MSLQDCSTAAGGVPVAADQHDTSPARPAAGGQRGGRTFRRTLTRIGLGLAVVAVAAFGVARAQGELPFSAASGAEGTSVVAAQNSAQDAAIQGVIQHANAEQVQAIASKDPSAMADTSTTAHFQELEQVNQQLLSSGVSSIALINVDWGPITVNGTTATATSYETWQTTYADGTTEQSRDQNDYSLVQQNGAWVIASDEHPSAGNSQPSSQSPQPSSPSPAVNPGQIGTSNNWSGYAATGGTFTAVSGTWTVPQYSASNSGGVDATWVGIGGVTSRDLIQAGTQEVASGNGLTQYQAWIELLPQSSHPVPLAVHAGDSVSVSIDQQAGNTWQIAFTNHTTGQTYQTSVQYTSSHSSAEWIEEAPSSGRGGILPLDNFGTVTFSDGAATRDGQTVDLAQAGAKPITLIGASQQPLAVPSALGSDGSSFSVSRTDAGATATQPGSSTGRSVPGSGYGRGGQPGTGYGIAPWPGLGFGG